MQRFLLPVALVLAVAFGAIAVLEIDNRADDDQLALPTTAPSPTARRSPRPLASPTASVPASPTSTATREPAASVTEEPETAAPATTRAPATPTARPTPTATVKPPPTPSPTAKPPVVTPGPDDRTKGETPTTGGGAVLPGLLMAGVALAVRASLSSRRRHT
jgi:cytoskeletal protein RodZ